MYRIIEIIFHEDIWLPSNVTWKDFKEESVPNLVLSIPFAVILLVLRYYLEKYCFAPIGKSFSMTSAREKNAPNPLLEQALAKHKEYDYKQIQGWAKQLDWSEHQVMRWILIHTKAGKPTTLTKYCQSSWRFTFYFSVFTFGLHMLWDEPWFWNFEECWKTYPHEPRTIEIYMYYSISLAYYWSLFVSQFFEIKTKGFWQMFVHHIAAIVLIVFSWQARFHRMGCIIVLMHDFGDILLEATKITKYCGFEKLCAGMFVIYSVSCIASVILVYPLWILRSMIFDFWFYHKAFPGFFIFNFCLIIIYMLHIWWTYLLIKLIGRLITARRLNDIRSDSEYSD